ncbi:hypothetical protein [Dendronalium sp. ChiSLP03b]|nr:hypothetical protein [Dendronalium sp. ChiSLP03b]
MSDKLLEVATCPSDRHPEVRMETRIPRDKSNLIKNYQVLAN